MTVIEIIRQSEAEHAEPCRVNEWREARLRSGEVPRVEDRLARRKLPGGWVASIVITNGQPRLRYTRQR